MAPSQAAPRHARLTSLVVSLALLLAPAARAQAVVDVELTDEGELRQHGVLLTQREFFELAGRRDLVERSDRNVTARWWLFGSAIAVGVAAAVVGSIILALTPNLDKPYCQSSLVRLEECQGYYLLYQRGGLITLAGGGGLALLLAGVGLFTRPDVLSTFDLAPLVDRYNREHAIPGP